jgi:hypothetical protein
MICNVFIEDGNEHLLSFVKEKNRRWDKIPSSTETGRKGIVLLSLQPEEIAQIASNVKTMDVFPNLQINIDDTTIIVNALGILER